MAPPVAPKAKLLPFHDPNFSWETFESFFCDFLAAHPEFVGKDGTALRVINAHVYGRRGDSQHGIDIRAEMSNGEIWVFQCKRYKAWGPKDTSRAITECGYDADRKFLLVTRAVSPESREIIAKHPEWELWDAGDISREFLHRLPAADAARIVYTNFGRGWSEELLGISGSAPLVTAEAKFAPLFEPENSGGVHRPDPRSSCAFTRCTQKNRRRRSYIISGL
jgi:restriction endonuclease